MHSFNRKESLLLRRLSRAARFRFLIPASTVIFLFAALSNVYLAARYGALVDRNLAALIEDWLSRPDLQASYSGAYVVAMDKLDMAVFMLGLGAIVIGQIFAMRPIHRLASKILPILEDQNQISPLQKGVPKSNAAAFYDGGPVKPSS